MEEFFFSECKGKQKGFFFCVQRQHHRIWWPSRKQSSRGKGKEDRIVANKSKEGAMRTHLIFLTTAILFVVVFAQGQTPISSASYSSYEHSIQINTTNPRNDM